MTTPISTVAPVAPRGHRRRVVLGPLVSYTLRSCIGRKRIFGILLPCLGMLLFGLLSQAIDQPATEAFAGVACEGIFSLLLPIATLVIGDAVLGAEVRSGVLHFTWLSPASLFQVVLGRWLGGALVALLTLVPAIGVAALIAGVPDSAGPAMVAAAFGGLAYLAVFIAIGSVARRAAVWSLVAVFFVERVLGGALAGVAQWSPQWEARAAFVGMIDGAPHRLVRDGVPSGGAALVRLGLITVIALGISWWRLGHVKLAGPSD